MALTEEERTKIIEEEELRAAIRSKNTNEGILNTSSNVLGRIFLIVVAIVFIIGVFGFFAGMK